MKTINVSVPANQAEAKFSELIKDAYLLDESGNKVGDAKDAFDGIKKGYPVFEANVDGQTKYIMSLNGAGLWGPIWGYISVNNDKNTVFGTDFSHQGETPGLISLMRVKLRGWVLKLRNLILVSSLQANNCSKGVSSNQLL